MNKKLALASFSLLTAVIASANNNISIDYALSYDDVLLVPQKSNVVSRKNVSTKTQLTKKIKLHIPIISANMDTVTESKMAIAIAQLGGVGVIHRFNTIEDQVHEVLTVKRYRNAIIEHPITISGKETLRQARKIMAEHNISSLLVVNNQSKLTGILTSRDIRFSTDKKNIVDSLMTPKEQLITGNEQTTVEKAQTIMLRHKIEKLPLIHEDWSIAGLITSKDILKKRENPNATTDKKDRLIVGAAIGVNADAIPRATALIKANVDFLVIDIAHGHSSLAINAIKNVKAIHPNIDIIAGNVATAEGTRELIEAGADAIKVGVGPGSICTTRITTGCGYPQLSAVMNCAQVADMYDIPVIADGGIKLPADITKAIAGGASTVMLGNLLAGTDESPGKTLIRKGKKFKIIRGMASFGAHLGRSASKTETKKDEEFVPEGVEALTPYKGSITEVIPQLLGGFWSGMSYCGVSTLDELRGNGHFIQITSAGVIESRSHDVQEL